MKSGLLLLAVAAICSASSFTLTTVKLTDCAPNGNAFSNCAGKVTDGDTTIFTSFSSVARGGTFTYNGTTVSGLVIGTTNDSNLQYSDPEVAIHGYAGSTNCGPFNSGNILLWYIPVLDTLHPNDGTNLGTILPRNCLSSFSASGEGDGSWSPAGTGACTSGTYAGTCDWKSQGHIAIDGKIYLHVQRQEKYGSLASFRAHDGTLIMSADGGQTWVNPAHVGRGRPQADGDAPKGPGDPTYPASILWPDPASHNGCDQKIGRLMFVQYAQDGATMPRMDNNATYVNALAYDGCFTNIYAVQLHRANLQNLSLSGTRYYHCPDYSTEVCDGMDSANWSSVMSDATPVGTIGGANGFLLGGLMYNSELATYIHVGGANGNPVNVLTAPHFWGPWILSGTQSVLNNQAGFTSPILATVKTLIPGQKIQFEVSETLYTHNGSGTLGFVTMQLEAETARTPGHVNKPPGKR